MVTAFASQPWWMTLSIVLMLLLVLTVGLVTWSYDLRRARLPEAARWEDLTQRLVAMDVHIREKGELLREMDQKIQDRDRVAAEVAALMERLSVLRAELDALSEAERQVEEMKHKAAEAVEGYALEQGKLMAARNDLSIVQGEIAAARQALVALGQKTEERQRELERLGLVLPADIEELKGVIERLHKEIDGLRGERGALLTAREEIVALLARKGQLEQETDALRAQVETIRGGEVLAEFQRARAAIVEQIAGLRAERARAEAQISEVDGLTAKKAALEERIGRLRSDVTELNGLKEEIERLKDERVGLRDVREEVATLLARKAVLEKDIWGGDRGPDSASGDDNVEDLVRLPVCLVGATGSPRDAQQEDEALHDVGTYLKNIGLKYDQRTIAAFHTSLKINDISQMTVLAGVSGTGKSLLPRRYAEAMGIHFLQIAVEPRWDSPQDLLGFYNYIEKRYRGTELARALVHMDPFNTSGLAKTSFGDHVLLVLLDEMNLARVEYYFSEFLSRLEVRPRWSDAQDEAGRAGACLPIEIRGRNEGPLRLFPSQNVLFAGTMNDDESTQALSDKVLDRSNVMQFAAPGEFARLVENKDALLEADFRSYAAWRKWINSADTLTGGDRDKAEGVIEKLAEIMEGCGRPFGHRLNEAMLTYVANYPRQKNDTVNDPLADQVEFRILPKLRGLAIEEHQQQFEDLAKLVREELRDQQFADRLTGLVERQRNGSGQFNWRGLDRGLG